MSEMADEIERVILRGLIDRRVEVEGPDFDYADSYLIAYARSVRTALERAHLLLPVPVEVRTEYGAWCHAENRDGIRLSQDQFTSRERAAEWGDEQIGRYGIAGYRILRRDCHVFAEGARFATAITAWAEDTEGKS